MAPATQMSCQILGADISAADKPLLYLLNDHVHNFLPSEVIQQTGKMYPLG